jgi:hypothetical protein
MMPGPYHEWSRIQSSERVEKAFKEGRSKDVRKRIKPRNPQGVAHLTIYGLLITWALFMTAMIGLWVWIG